MQERKYIKQPFQADWVCMECGTPNPSTSIGCHGFCCENYRFRNIGLSTAQAKALVVQLRQADREERVHA